MPRVRRERFAQEKGAVKRRESRSLLLLNSPNRTHSKSERLRCGFSAPHSLPEATVLNRGEFANRWFVFVFNRQLLCSSSPFSPYSVFYQRSGCACTTHTVPAHTHSSGIHQLSLSLFALEHKHTHTQNPRHELTPRVSLPPHTNS